MGEAFDSQGYWENRHAELFNDHRNVGNRGLTSDQNLVLIGSKAALVAHRLGKLDLDSDARILDAGCGAGVFTYMLSTLGYTLYGVDVSPTAIRSAQEKACAEFSVAPLSGVAFAHQFEAVLCLDVLFHVIDDTEWAASVRNLFELVAPLGVIVIIEFFPTEEVSEGDYCRWRSANDYMAVLPEAEWLEVSAFRYPYELTEKTLLIARKAA
jgi:2-polyprenyl-3-methyl-5-hydroxy-6-metoxy-1,4-benzoquinol methylase